MQKLLEIAGDDPAGTEYPASGSHRRRLVLKALLGLVAGILGKRALAAKEEPEPSLLVTEGELLRTGVYKGRPPMEPLDTMIRFERSDDNNGRAMTHEILSLMHEEKGENSYPWTIYAHLSTNHHVGDACVLCSRLHKNDRGWSSGLHSEVFNSGPMVGLGMNVEMTNNYPGPEPTELTGVNIQIMGPHPCQHGIQVHGQGPCEKGIGLNGKGEMGIDIAGRYGIGVNMHGNSIRLDEGSGIELDGVGKVRLRYKDGRIEFLNGDRCVGHISTDSEDHEL